MNNTFRTEKQIQDLKDNWILDPCWDIEDTEGFEYYKEDLKIFRLEHEIQQQRNYDLRIKKLSRTYGTHSPTLIEKLISIEKRLEDLEETL